MAKCLFTLIRRYFVIFKIIIYKNSNYRRGKIYKKDTQCNMRSEQDSGVSNMSLDKIKIRNLHELSPGQNIISG